MKYLVFVTAMALGAAVMSSQAEAQCYGGYAVAGGATWLPRRLFRWSTAAIDPFIRDMAMRTDRITAIDKSTGPITAATTEATVEATVAQHTTAAVTAAAAATLVLDGERSVT